MAPSDLSVSVRDLDAAGKAFHFPLRAAWIRSAVEGTDVSATEHDGLLDVRLSKSGNDVVLRGTLTAELVVPCARCLEPARVPIHETLSTLFVPERVLKTENAPGDHGRARDRDDDHEHEHEGVASAPDVVPYDGETVVLDGLVRDEMLLALPIVPLCSESCTGIRLEASAPSTAADTHPVDPRLMPLLSLKKKT